MSKSEDIIGPDAMADLDAAGFAVVPKEPTKKMVKAAKDWAREANAHPFGAGEPAEIYRAMIEAGRAE